MTNTTEFIRCDLLSIDAWRECEGGWQWNSWQTIEKGIYFSEDSLTPRRILKALRKWNYLTTASKGKLAIDDDGYNITIINKDTFEPILALAYGEYI